MGYAFELLFKVVGAIGGVILGLYELRSRRPTKPSTLKTDLEILKMLEPSDPSYSILKAHIDADIKRAYSSDEQRSDSTKRLRVYDWSGFTLGVAFFIGFCYWTILIVKDGFSWWSILTGFFAFVGIATIVNSLEPPKSAGK